MNSSILTYKKFADLYDLYVGEFDTDFDFYKFYCNRSDKVIEIGCGTGRILDILLNQDCIVTGVDISEEMLQKAREKFSKWITSGKLTLINHDFSIDKLKVHFHKALLTFYTFNYILDNTINFLSNVNDSIEKNGLLLMDLFYPNSLYDKSINGKWIDKEFTFGGHAIKIRDCRTMYQDIEHRQQIFNIRGIETKIDTRRKYYSPKDLRELLIASGFKQVEFSYNYDYKGFNSMIDPSRLKTNYIVKAKK